MHKALGSSPEPHKVEHSDPCLHPGFRRCRQKDQELDTSPIQQVQVQPELHEILLKGGKEGGNKANDWRK